MVHGSWFFSSSVYLFSIFFPVCMQTFYKMHELLQFTTMGKTQVKYTQFVPWHNHNIAYSVYHFPVNCSICVFVQHEKLLGKNCKKLVFLHFCFVFYFDVNDSVAIGVINKTYHLIRRFRRNCRNKLFQSSISTEILTPSSMVMIKPNKICCLKFHPKCMRTNQMIQIMVMLTKATKFVWINKYMLVVWGSFHVAYNLVCIIYAKPSVMHALHLRNLPTTFLFRLIITRFNTNSFILFRWR